MLTVLVISSAVCAAVPALLTLINLGEYRPPPQADDGEQSLTVIIPVRNEEAGIAACLQSVLASQGTALRILVIDDASTDRTTDIVAALAAGDSRLTLQHAPALPAGWNGKQHACWVAAQGASSAYLCFLDADVQLHPAALARCAHVLRQTGSALVSGFPKEVTGTWLEKLLIPLIHFILLGLLPMRLLRTTTAPGFAAGCGQFLMVDRTAYLESGGHAAIRQTMHDGLLLPRLLRQHGFHTRLVDLTELASCRMYHSARTTWNGLAKNATEGIAAPVRIVPMTLLLTLGQVLPLPLLLSAWQHTSFVIPFLGPPIRIGMAAVWTAIGAVFLSYLPRLMNALRYKQSWLGAILHPVSVAVLLALQWYALGRKLLGRPAEWKARNYVAN